MKTETKPTHTPTPWRVIEGDREHAFNIVHDSENGGTAVVRDVLKEANAAFIVRAVNAHEELLKIAHWALTRTEIDSVNAEKIREAIAKAEGR